jgi:hypothetical protein
MRFTGTLVGLADLNTRRGASLRWFFLKHVRGCLNKPHRSSGRPRRLDLPPARAIVHLPTCDQIIIMDNSRASIVK